MAEVKKVERKPLGRASESSDPAVHQLLAEMQTALANGNDAEVEATARKLAKLGYE